MGKTVPWHKVQKAQTSIPTIRFYLKAAIFYNKLFLCVSLQRIFYLYPREYKYTVFLFKHEWQPPIQVHLHVSFFT